MRLSAYEVTQWLSIPRAKLIMFSYMLDWWNRFRETGCDSVCARIDLFYFIFFYKTGSKKVMILDLVLFSVFDVQISIKTQGS